MCLPTLGSFISSRIRRHDAHRRRVLLAGEAIDECPVVVELGRFERRQFVLRRPRRNPTAERLAPLAKVLHLRRIVGRLVERRFGNVVVGDRNREPRAELAQLLLVVLLLLVRHVAAFARFAQAVALDRLGEDHGRPALGLDRRLVGREYLFRIVAAAVELLELLVRKMADQFAQLGVLAEEVLADVICRA